MTAQDIDGKSIAATIRSELAAELSSLPSGSTSRPGLAVMLVGSRKDSQTYVRMKQKACSDCGMVSFLQEYPNGEEVEEEMLLKKIREWNEDEKVHGILVQLPLPEKISEERILKAVDPKKVRLIECVTSVRCAILCSHQSSLRLQRTQRTSTVSTQPTQPLSSPPPPTQEPKN
jgi:5,10-methylene-tetrahydrofolate dehydrogenase/methenyl tetrahydrofolate cyclohydrolase